MSARVRQLESDYIVIKFYQEENRKQFLRYDVTDVPTIVVFNKGKEVRRHEGIHLIEDITKDVKTEEEQNRHWWDWLKLY